MCGMDPYFNHRKNERSAQRMRIRFYLIGCGAMLAVIGMIYVILYSPVFRIRSFVISGKERYSDREIIGIVEPLVLNTQFKNFLGPDNIIAWNISNPDISKTGLSQAGIERDWLRQTVKIRVEERNRLAIWCDANNDCDWIDDGGMAFEPAPQTEGSLIVAVHDDAASRITQGSRVLEDRFMDNLLAIIRGISAMKLPFRRISYDERLQEIHVENFIGPEILFNIRFNPDQNISSMIALEGKTDISRIKYIDLRVENRLYYK